MSAILELTMTDKLHYPDLFTTINIPEAEKTLALEARHLFDIANGVEPSDGTIFEHMNSRNDSESASQIFWDFEDDTHHAYDRLALTAMRGTLTFGMEYRNFDDPSAAMRRSLIITRGLALVYVYDLRNRKLSDGGTINEYDTALFKKDLLAAASRLGLYAQAKLHLAPQNKSGVAPLANAA